MAKGGGIKFSKAGGGWGKVVPCPLQKIDFSSEPALDPVFCDVHDLQIVHVFFSWWDLHETALTCAYTPSGMCIRILHNGIS